MNIELIGYIATVFILGSLAVSNLKVLRILNSLGGLSWIVYGVLGGAPSIVIGNGLMVVINIVKYIKENKKQGL
jgi:hypothetical protein